VVADTTAVAPIETSVDGAVAPAAAETERQQAQRNALMQQPGNRNLVPEDTTTASPTQIETSPEEDSTERPSIIIPDDTLSQAVTADGAAAPFKLTAEQLAKKESRKAAKEKAAKEEVNLSDFIPFKKDLKEFSKSEEEEAPSLSEFKPFNEDYLKFTDLSKADTLARIKAGPPIKADLISSTPPIIADLVSKKPPIIAEQVSSDRTADLRTDRTANLTRPSPTLSPNRDQQTLLVTQQLQNTAQRRMKPKSIFSSLYDKFNNAYQHVLTDTQKYIMASRNAKNKQDAALKAQKVADKEQTPNTVATAAKAKKEAEAAKNIAQNIKTELEAEQKTANVLAAAVESDIKSTTRTISEEPRTPSITRTSTAHVPNTPSITRTSTAHVPNTPSISNISEFKPNMPITMNVNEPNKANTNETDILLKKLITEIQDLRDNKPKSSCNPPCNPPCDSLCNKLPSIPPNINNNNEANPVFNISINSVPISSTTDTKIKKSDTNIKKNDTNTKTTFDENNNDIPIPNRNAILDQSDDEDDNTSKKKQKIDNIEDTGTEVSDAGTEVSNTGTEVSDAGTEVSNTGTNTEDQDVEDKNIEDLAGGEKKKLMEAIIEENNRLSNYTDALGTKKKGSIDKNKNDSVIFRGMKVSTSFYDDGSLAPSLIKNQKGGRTWSEWGQNIKNNVISSRNTVTTESTAKKLGFQIGNLVTCNVNDKEYHGKIKEIFFSKKSPGKLNVKLTDKFGKPIINEQYKTDQFKLKDCNIVFDDLLKKILDKKNKKMIKKLMNKLQNIIKNIDALNINDHDYESKLSHLNNSFDLINNKIEKLKLNSHKELYLLDRNTPNEEKEKIVNNNELDLLRREYEEIKSKRIKAEQLLRKINPNLYNKLTNSPLAGGLNHNKIHGGLKLIQKAGSIPTTEPSLQEILINSNNINKFAQNILST
jgi:hypothetical protein